MEKFKEYSEGVEQGKDLEKLCAVKTHIKLSKHEIQSGLSRVGNAEGLIEQLPENHDGRNTWLMNYGIREEAVALRANDKQKSIDGNYAPRVLVWDDETDCLKGVS